jgi:hypothetical protein
MNPTIAPPPICPAGMDCTVTSQDWVLLVALLALFCLPMLVLRASGLGCTEGVENSFSAQAVSCDDAALLTLLLTRKRVILLLSRIWLFRCRAT